MLVKSFRGKVWLMVAASLGAVAVVAAINLYQNIVQIEESRRGQLTAALQSAHSVVLGYQARAQKGELSDAEAQRLAADAIRTVRYGGADGKSDYCYIFTLDGRGVMHPFKPEWAGQPLMGKVKDGEGRDLVRLLADALRASREGRAFVLTSFPRPGQTEPVAKLQLVQRVEGWDWMIGSGLYIDDVAAAERAAAFKGIAAVMVVLGVLGGLGVWLSRSVMQQLGGDPRLVSQAIGEVAQGRLEVQLPPAAPGSVVDALSRMAASLQRTVGDVRSTSDSIGLAASEIAAGNADLSQRTEQTASNLEKTASAMQELTGTVRQSADAARTANQLAGSAAETARRGGEVVGQVVTTMAGINEASRRIADIIGTIDGIAFQTNILALNAAVEAARAGEQGRGFAVVAGEVRNLAQRSATAAREIKTLIGASVEQVESGTKLVEGAGSTMQEIVASVQRVTDIVGEITAASSEQSEGIGRINDAVVQLDQMTQQNAALVEQSAAAAESLREQARRLTGAVAGFQVGATA